jgi:hypothetical protein
MHVQRWVGMGLLAGALVMPSLSVAVTPDIPAMATKFATAMKLDGTPVCTLTAVAKSEFWVCQTPLVAGVTIAPVAYLCHPDEGCRMPIGPMGIPETQP